MRLLPLLVLIAKAIASINDADLLFSRGGIPDVAIPAEGSVVNPARKLQVSGCSTVGYDAEIFQDRTFDVSDYTTYDGLDPTALFASSIDMTDEYAVVGSDGYNIFQGIVHVYSPISETTWGLQALIRTPTHDNANFGVSVAVDGSRILVGANGYNVYDGAVFVYDWVLDTYWQNTARILSPLEGRNISQGFGYRVDLSGDFAIISTAINNAYIYEKQDKNWVPNTDLAPPADDVRFGRSVAIFGDYAIVGATGVGGSEGAAYIYRKFSSSGISTSSVYWDLYLELQSVEGYSSYFGYSVDINDRMAVVGAVGYRDRVWDSRGERRANDTGWVYIYPLNETTESSLTDKGPMTAIQSPVGDAGNFGAAVTLQDDSVLIGADGFPCGAEEGGAFLYTQDPADGTWALNRSYPSIDGPGSHFGWQVGLSPSYLAVGAFGYQDLQGAIHFAARKTPRFSASPTMLPSAAPTFEPTGVAAGLNIGGSNPDNNEELQIGLIVALFLAVLLAAIATGATIWCCCCFVVPVAGAKKKKKKKKEEENSPYTVHSYRGYSETDEYEYSEYDPSVISETYAPSYAPAPPMKKGGEKSVKFMDEEALRRAFPYKVYGPRGYQEGQNMDQEDLVRMKVEMNGDSKDLKFPVSQSAFPPPSAADMHDPRRQHQHGYPHHYSYTHHQKPQQQQYQPPSRPLSERSMYSAEGSYNTYGSSGASGSSYYSSSQTETEGGGEGDDDRSQYSSDSRSYTTQSQSIYSQRDRDGDGPSIAGDSYYSGRGSERESDREEPSVQLSAVQQAKVEEARAKYRAFKERSGSSGSRGGSSYEDSRFSGGASGGSLVESARARGRDYVRQGTEQSHQVVLSAEGGGGTESAEEDGQSVVSGSSGSQGSYVEQARERYARIVRRDGASAASATSGAGSEGEERLVSAGSDTSSLVHSAKARYATLREQQQPPQQQPPQRSGYRSSSGDESQTHTYAGSSAGSSHASSLVEAAKARYAAMSRKMASTSGDSAEQSSGWDPQSLQTSNNRPFKQQSRGGDGSADESELNSQSASESHNVSLNVGYSRSVSSSRTQGLSVDVHSSSTAAQAPVQTQAPAAASGLPTISPATQARVNNARQAAMSKFALYKAKAEDEARRRAHDEARMQEQVLLERKQLEEVQRQREEEDDRVERAVEEARRRAERSEIEARAAARAHAEMEHSQHAEERQQQREQARLRAEQRARENFERAKAAEAAELLSRGSVSGSAAGSGSSVSVGSAPTAGAVMTASSPYSTEQQQRYDVIMAARAKMAETDANLTAARQRMASVSDDTANAVARSTLVSSSSSTTHTVTTTSSSKVVQNSTTTSSSIGGSSAVSSHTFSSATAGEDQSRDNGPQLAQLKDA